MRKVIKNNLPTQVLLRKILAGKGNFFIVLLIFLMVVGWVFSGWPQIWKKPPIPPEIKEVRAATATYNFSLCGTDCDTSLNWWASADDVDVFPFAGVTANRNTHNEATDAQYSSIASSNNTRWASADPGAGDEIFLWIEMKINEGITSISQIDLTFEGYLALRANFSIWVKKTGEIWEQNASWVQVGTSQSITAGVETSFTRSITANFGDYIGADGMLTWGVYEDVSSERMNIDYLKADVTYTPPTIPTITVGTTGNQVSSMNIPSTNQYVGGAFTISRNIGSADVTQIVITDTGTVNANLNLSNAVLFYKQETTCSTSIPTDATQYNATGAGFNASEKATTTGTMTVGTAQVCVYVRLDVGSGASADQTIEIEISNSSTEVIVSAGTVSPTTQVAIAGTTTLQVPVVPPATWKTAEDTSITNVNKNENIRLRIEVANKGSETPDYNYLLEYALKVGATCGDNESFIVLPVTASTEHFEMTDSIYFTNGDPTTSRLTVPNGYTFIPGKMVEDPSNNSGYITLPYENYTEIEFVFQATTNAINGGSYCFRLTNTGTPLEEYSYPELQIAP